MCEEGPLSKLREDLARPGQGSYPPTVTRMAADETLAVAWLWKGTGCWPNVGVHGIMKSTANLQENQAMEIQLSDIHSLSDFQRNTKEHLREMERSGHPRVLTVNGKAKVVVQDARAYQKLLAQLEEAATVLTLRRRLASMRGGKKGRPLVDVLEELGGRGTRSRAKK